MDKHSFLVIEHISNNKLEEAMDMMKVAADELGKEDLKGTYVALRFKYNYIQQQVIKGILIGNEKMQQHSLIVDNMLNLNRLLKNARAEGHAVKQPTLYSKEIETLIHQNVYSVITRDIVAMEQTLHPECPIYDSTMQYMREFVNRPEIKIVIDVQNLRFFDIGEVTAVMQLEQYTRNTDPTAQFNSNKMTQVNIFKKHYNDWKLYDSTVREVEYIDI